jgi:SAM-dependent methyltransferase
MEENHELKDLFNNVYNKKLWGNNTSVSGPGSTLEQTIVIREEILRLLINKGIKTILDAPCGDFFWMRDVIIKSTEIIDFYIGYDIVDELIEINNKRFASDKIKFEIADITKDNIPKSDLIICRDCLIHLSFQNIYRIIRNFKKSKSKYLLLSTYINPERTNRDLDDSKINFRALNMQKFPFSFPAPSMVINENCTEFEGGYYDKSLSLWEINKINLLKFIFNLKIYRLNFFLERIKRKLKKSIALL